MLHICSGTLTKCVPNTPLSGADKGSKRALGVWDQRGAGRAARDGHLSPGSTGPVPLPPALSTQQ